MQFKGMGRTHRIPRRLVYLPQDLNVLDIDIVSLQVTVEVLKEKQLIENKSLLFSTLKGPHHKKRRSNFIIC
jgi:hypothetical protein